MKSAKLSRRLLTLCQLLLSFSLMLNNQLILPALVAEQKIIISSDDTLDLEDEALLHAPVRFTTSGLQCYLKHVYNHPKYNEILANDLSHLLQFLEYGQQTKQPEAYLISTLRLFHQKFFTLEYLSAQQLNRLINLLPKVLADYHTPKVEQLVLRLLENGLTRILWSPADHDGVWRQFTELGHKITALNEAAVITDVEDCNDLLTDLIARFAYVIGLIGSDLPVSFYEQAYRELRNQQLSWLNISETETLIASKRDHLEHILLVGTSKAQARAKFGTITSPIVAKTA